LSEELACRSLRARACAPSWRSQARRSPRRHAGACVVRCRGRPPPPPAAEKAPDAIRIAGPCVTSNPVIGPAGFFPFVLSGVVGYPAGLHEDRPPRSMNRAAGSDRVPPLPLPTHRAPPRRHRTPASAGGSPDLRPRKKPGSLAGPGGAPWRGRRRVPAAQCPDPSENTRPTRGSFAQRKLRPVGGGARGGPSSPAQGPCPPPAPPLRIRKVPVLRYYLGCILRPPWVHFAPPPPGKYRSTKRLRSPLPPDTGGADAERRLEGLAARRGIVLQRTRHSDSIGAREVCQICPLDDARRQCAI